MSTQAIPLLAVGLVPYLVLALVDGWMHEKHRRVPKTEQWLHALIFLFVGTFIVAAFLGLTLIAAIALIGAIPVLAADELGFHAELAARERKVHYLADLSLAGFAGLWLITVFT